MKINNSHVKLKVKMKKSEVFLGTTSILFIIFTLLSFLSIKQPLQYQKKTILNNIIQKTNITYSTDALPDGLKGANGIIFSKVQKNMRVHITSTVSSEKPVSITGDVTVYYDLIAESLWTITTPISSKIKLDLNGSKNTIIDSDFQINLEGIKNIIDKAENQIIGTSPEKYTIKIKPDFHGNILYENKTIPLDNTYELNFEYHNGLLKLIGENKEIVKNTPVESLTVTTNKLTFLGISLPIMLSRYIFSITALVILILVIVNLKMSRLITRKNTQSVNYIDKKFGNRLIHLQQEPRLQNKILLPLNDYKELIRIGDEKELNILKFNKINSDIVVYLVIDGECIFNYVISSVEPTDSINTKNSILGSDILNG